jgi:hypothetical protein
MKNTLWHFGDSFACWYNEYDKKNTSQKGYSEYISDNYNLKFKHFGKQGIGNDYILNSIISNLNSFTPGDFILINWSFFTRFAYLNKNNKIDNFNNLQRMILDDSVHIKSEQELLKNYNKYKLNSAEYFNYLINYKYKFVREENIILWKNIINPILKNITDNGCIIINSFNDNVSSNSEIYDVNGIVDIENDILDSDIKKINWCDGGEYIEFLFRFNFYAENQDIHYKFGVQESLSKEWIKRIDSQILTKL